MLFRIYCQLGRGELVGLSQVAAVGSVIATSAEATARGLSGKPACAPTGLVDVPIFHVAERVFQPPFRLDGDGLVAWGEPGGRYENVSPQGGWRIGVGDTQAMVVAQLQATLGATLTETQDAVGFFTTRQEWAPPAGALRYVFLGTDGGAHTASGTRFDFHPMLRLWDFLSAHKRTPSGVVRGASSTLGTF